jgi:S1-C subfamily serine protease
MGNAVDVDPRAQDDIVPLVAPVSGAIDVGVELAGYDGPVVMEVSKEVEAIGLRRGDVVVAVDGIPVDGLDLRAVHALGFELRPGQTVAWLVKRGDDDLRFLATAAR